MMGQPTEGALIALAMKVSFKIFQNLKKKKSAGIVRSESSDQMPLKSPDWF